MSPRSLTDRLRAAAYRSWRIVDNARIDLRYGPPLAVDRTAEGWRLNIRSSDYAALEQIFHDRIRGDDVLIDVGCSSGRVINFWLDKGHRNRIVGIELDPVVAAAARKRLHAHANVQIITGDAIGALPDDASLLYVYNPFGREVMEAFRDRAAALPERGSRPVILYYNCKHVDIFENDDRFDVERIELPAPSYAPLSPLAIIARR